MNAEIRNVYLKMPAEYTEAKSLLSSLLDWNSKSPCSLITNDETYLDPTSDIANRVKEECINN
jgi:hypothetical protein